MDFTFKQPGKHPSLPLRSSLSPLLVVPPLNLVGVTAAGPPVSGTYMVGDLIVDTTGKAWACGWAGSPGRWIEVVIGDWPTDDLQGPAVMPYVIDEEGML